MTDPIYIDRPHYVIIDKRGEVIKRIAPETTIGDALQIFVEYSASYNDVTIGFQFPGHISISSIAPEQVRFLFIKRQEMLDRQNNT